MHKPKLPWAPRLDAAARCVLSLRLTGKSAVLAVWFMTMALVGVVGSQASLAALVALVLGGLATLRSNR
jgi:hypothetical protein